MAADMLKKKNTVDLVAESIFKIFCTE